MNNFEFKNPTKIIFEKNTETFSIQSSKIINYI